MNTCILIYSTFFIFVHSRLTRSFIMQKMYLQSAISFSLMSSFSSRWLHFLPISNARIPIVIYLGFLSPANFCFPQCNPFPVFFIVGRVLVPYYPTLWLLFTSQTIQRSSLCRYGIMMHFCGENGTSRNDMVDRKLKGKNFPCQHFLLVCNG